jgi:hypothetical protein
MASLSPQMGSNDRLSLTRTLQIEDMARGAEKSVKKTALALFAAVALTIGGTVLAFTASPLIGGLVSLVGVATLATVAYKYFSGTAPQKGVVPQGNRMKIFLGDCSFNCVNGVFNTKRDR